MAWLGNTIELNYNAQIHPTKVKLFAFQATYTTKQGKEVTNTEAFP